MQTRHRGISVLHSLLAEESEPSATGTSERKGRNPALIQTRNTNLLYRFYYKSKVERKLYPDSVSELVKEFHLSAVMIQKIIQAKTDELMLIKKEQPSVKSLKEKYPHMVW
ncbi:hypothetical protein SAMN05421788_101824 [Filimonas lacunae]|uniref:Uncharacterized protein n=1 Tax=Filimonas lacunae TaxID=477680 RepID=A0A173MPJ9_9BACT|nr:hypothetical protein [Filimonas lacunae]BAV09387.1 hypothetical protein FLA_5435 [Filimonas lacunae]SIS72235.1 hypothetical protein SAMN05421788_101824 [Filimonas lacunae]